MWWLQLSIIDIEQILLVNLYFHHKDIEASDVCIIISTTPNSQIFQCFNLNFYKQVFYGGGKKPEQVLG